MAALCPHCGYDLELDAPVSLGGASYSHAKGLIYNGHPVKLEASQRIVVHSLLKAGGEVLTSQALIERLDVAETVNPLNNLNIHIHRLRRALEPLGGRPCVKNIHGVGWCWDASAAEPERLVA